MVFFLSLVSATDLGVFKQNECVTLYQLCDSCTFVNVTSVKQPNQTQIINDLMTNFGFDFTYEYCNTSQIGGYQYNVCGDKGGGIACENINFDITRNGTELTIAESRIYSILAVGVFVLFLLSFYFMLMTPYSNKIDGNSGAVIQLTKLKYVKLGLILLTWVLLTWFLNILIGLSNNFVSLTMYIGFFGFIFDVMNRLALPLGVIIIVIAFFEIIRDANIQENIKKFGHG